MHLQRENPTDVSVILSRNTGQRAVVNVAAAPGATPMDDHFTPGTFTNQIQAAFWNARLLVATYPRAEHQPLSEMSYVSLPAIALGNADSPLCGVAITFPCKKKGDESVGLMWWMLALKVLRMRGITSCKHSREVVPDLCFYRYPAEKNC